MDYDVLLKKAAACCSRQEMCNYDIDTKLRHWGAGEKQAKEIIHYLEKERYIDAERYCRAFVNDKLRFNKWGKLKIAQALAAKRIENSIVEQVLSEIELSLYEKMLLEILSKKVKEIVAASDYERRGKLINFALQRGFDYETAERAAKKVLK